MPGLFPPSIHGSESKEDPLDLAPEILALGNVENTRYSVLASAGKLGILPA